MDILNFAIYGTAVVGFGYVAVGAILSAVAGLRGSRVEIKRVGQGQAVATYESTEVVQEIIEQFDAWEAADSLAPTATAAKAMPAQAVLVVPVAEAGDLTELTIRQLKKLASEAKVKGYCNMRKAELIERLQEVS
jgi:hypothetical protein